MIYEEQIEELLKDPAVKRNINTQTYYLIKALYNRNFQKRSRILCKILIKESSFETQKGEKSFSIFQFVEDGGDYFYEQNLEEQKKIDNEIESLTKEEFVSKLASRYDISLFDEYDNYIIVKLLYLYLFSDETPESSNLFISYHLFCTELELLFCLKVASRLPEYLYITNTKENKLFKNNHTFLAERAKLFLEKFEESKLKKAYEGTRSFSFSRSRSNSLSRENNTSNLSESSSYIMEEPILPNKLVPHWKVLSEGIFYFDIEEITKQLCLIDQKFLRKVFEEGFKNFLKFNDSLKAVSNIMLREKHLICYVLMSILNQSTLENIKIIIQNFISLASSCRRVRNYQSCYTIISCFYNAKLKEKKIIWNMIEKKFKDMYLNIEKDYTDVYLKEMNVEVTSRVTMVPNIHSVVGLMHKFISRRKDSSIQSMMQLSNDYRDFYNTMKEVLNLKFPFFKVNPLYLFLKFGMVEISHAKKWNVKLKHDFTNLDILEIEQRTSVFLETLYEKFDRYFDS